MFGMDDGKLKLAQVESGKVLAQLSAHEASVESVRARLRLGLIGLQG
jgi:hypothetical protein